MVGATNFIGLSMYISRVCDFLYILIYITDRTPEVFRVHSKKMAR